MERLLGKGGWLAVAVFVAALAATAALHAQAADARHTPQPAAGGVVQMAQVRQRGPGEMGRWGEMSEAERARLRDRMIQRMLDESGLTDKEKAAAKKALKAKSEARQALINALTNLRRTANKAKPTDKELQAALTAYRAAMAQYRKKVQAEDAALIKQLSLKGQVRCMSLGILDNGLGGPGRMGMAGRPGRPGARG